MEVNISLNIPDDKAEEAFGTLVKLCTPATQIKPKMDTKPVELPKRPCEMCGFLFTPNRKNHRFHRKSCNDKWRRHQKKAKEWKPKVVDEVPDVQPPSKPKPFTIPASDKLNRNDINNMQTKIFPVSRNSFYQKELQKAAKRDPATYAKYVD
jgi:hypothetical protein